MAQTRARHGSYAFQRPGSANWYAKLRHNGRRIEVSLGTSDKLEAEAKLHNGFMYKGEVISIGTHKAALLAARPRLETVPKLEPGREHAGPDGGKIVATDKELIHIGHNGSILRIEPNIIERLANVPMGAVVHFGNPTRPVAELRGVGSVIDVSELERPTVGKKSGDDAILETYLSSSGIVGYDRKEAETVWATFKRLTDNKPLLDCDRNDGRKLAAYFAEAGNKRATVVKKVGWLRAAVELAIDEDKTGKWTFNPFSNVVPKPKNGEGDELERQPLDDADMNACRKNLDALDESGKRKLSEVDALLYRVLASTGMRLSEAFEIAGEATEKGVRYVVIGEKTEQSKRRVPLPASLLPHLPKRIIGHLFGDDTRANHRLASKRLNRYLNDCGVVDKRKVIHSLRHRAQDRLRAAGAPQDIREALLGHSKVTVGEGYGVGFPVPMLRKWVNKIGF